MHVFFRMQEVGAQGASQAPGAEGASQAPLARTGRYKRHWRGGSVTRAVGAQGRHKISAQAPRPNGPGPRAPAQWPRPRTGAEAPAQEGRRSRGPDEETPAQGPRRREPSRGGLEPGASGSGPKIFDDVENLHAFCKISLIVKIGMHFHLFSLIRKN